MARADITPVILTWNEEANLERCLAALSWAHEIIVLDSGSTDGTLAIAATHPSVRVHHRAFDNHAAQANHALGLASTAWVLTLDADYILTPGLQALLDDDRLTLDPEAVYFARFRYCVESRPLRASLLPPRGVLFAREGAVYAQDGHTQQLVLGTRRSVVLEHPILHDDRKPLARWLRSQASYTELEVAKLRATPSAKLNGADRLRLRVWIVPLLMPPYLLIGRGLLLDGRRGLIYAFQRTYAELLLALHLLLDR